MKVVIRTDSSSVIGTGHVMRCLTLADQLRKMGAEVAFICRELRGSLCDLIEGKRYRLHRLPLDSNDIRDNYECEYAAWLVVSKEIDAAQTTKVISSLATKPDLLIVDHYALDGIWHRRLRDSVSEIMVIDDLANREYDCDLLLDQNLSISKDNRYQGLVPKSCELMLGPKFSLLRDEFATARKSLRNRDGTVKRVLVFFGGSDATGETEKAIEAISRIEKPDIHFDLVVGLANENRAEIERSCEQSDNIHYSCNVSNMAELMARADLALGAGGTTTWERCSLGLPSIIISIADNQRSIAKSANDAGIAFLLGDAADVTPESLANTMLDLMADPERIKSMSKEALSTVDGLGTARVCDRISSRVVAESTL